MTSETWTIRFFRSGYCWQLGWFARRRKLGPSKFAAVFLHISHPKHGSYLVDTGYGPQFHSATSRWPYRLHRWTTPVSTRVDMDPAIVLGKNDISLESIDGIFLTHFHADHIGGLSSLPTLPVTCRQDSLNWLRSLKPIEQVKNGFLTRLLPSSLPISDRTIEYESKHSVPFLSDFNACDWWGDGSMWIVDLPGHAEGHYGFLFPGVGQSKFYVADACWDVPALLHGKKIPAIAKSLQRDRLAYQATQASLRRYAAESNAMIIACHCLETEKLIGQAMT